MLLAMRRTLDPGSTIVPGHGPIGAAAEAIDWLIGYLRDLESTVHQAIADGLYARTAVGTSPIADRYPISPHAAELRPLRAHLHRLNVLATYRALEPGSRPV